MEFLKVFYTGVLGATDYWLRIEWQHRGSPHVHGLAWLPDTPDVERLGDSASVAIEEKIIKYAAGFHHQPCCPPRWQQHC